MTSSEIKSLAIESSGTYYDWLRQNNRGLITIEVYRKETGEHGLFKIVLATRLYDLESVQFFLDNEPIKREDIQIRKNDMRTRTLIIKPSVQWQEKFRDANTRDIVLKSDLTFLVKRVQEWYESGNNNVFLPTVKPCVLAPSDDDFLTKVPSEHQKEAINTIFSNSVSYIWGAPGTGKTRLVLAYSVLQYIQKEKRVVIFAPTNNALEQVLEGVLELLEEANIDKRKVVRLGTASAAFTDKYSECCETIGGRVTDLETEVKNLNQILKVREIIGKIELIESESNIIFTELKDRSLQREKILFDTRLLRQEIEDERTVYSLKHTNVVSLEHSITVIEKQINSLFFKIKRFFHKSNSLHIELEKKKSVLFGKVRDREVSSKKLRELKEKYDQLVSEYENIARDNELFRKLREISSEYEVMLSIISNITVSNFQDKTNELQTHIHRIKSELFEAQMLETEYKDLSVEAIKILLAEAEERLENFQENLKDRLENCNVVGLTLDRYIGSFKDDRILGSEMFHHYFLDEAGYAPLVKTLTLFRENIPITFLGDHMQLPPICEMKDREMSESPTFRKVFTWAQSGLYTEELFGVKDWRRAFADYIEPRDIPFVFSKMVKADLKETYRFGEALANILNDQVYNNGFIAHPENDEIKIEYIHVPQSNNLRDHQYEADAIKEQFENELGDIAFLTPYRDQVRLLKKTLDQKFKDDVLTIHGSQGREWDTVVISMVKPNPTPFINTTNLRGRQLINTAVSRAKKKLVIVCNHTTWTRGINSNQLIHHILQIKNAPLDTLKNLNSSKDR